jgi:N-acetyl-anhydromuramyl-L-alanine amidase AmpD
VEINRTHRLSEFEHFTDPQRKSMIVLHHTVSGSFESVWNYWNSDRNKDGSQRRVATAFVIDKDGTIYELFDPREWAHHIGSASVHNALANRRSIGIELVSEGALREINGKLFWMDGEIPYRSSTAAVYRTPEPWRGYSVFDAYEEMQIQALEQLLPELCREMLIPKRLLPPEDRNEWRPDLLLAYQGILSHCNLRADKTDVHPGFPWERIEKALK